MSGEKVNELAEKLKDICKSVTVVSDNRIVLEVDKERILEVAKSLLNLGFDHVKGVSGVDYPSNNTIDVIYYIGSYSLNEYANLIVEIKASLPRDNPAIQSLISVWKSCEYPERETYEMFGVKFEGHPKLKLMLLPDDFEGMYPLRKDFKIPEEGIEA